MPQRGKLLREGLGTGGVQAAVAAVEVGRVGRDRQQQRQHRAQAVAHAHGPLDVPHADVHVQAEGVVAPGHIFEAVLDAAVVLGVDDRLLAVVGPRVRRRWRPARRRGRRRARTAAGGARAGGRSRRAGRADARDDLDLRGDQLARDRVAQHLVRARRLLQLLEARHQFVRLRVEDRELLLDPDRQVRGVGEDLRRAV